MGAFDTWNVEINILVYENEIFWLPVEFHFNEWNIVTDIEKGFLMFLKIKESLLVVLLLY